MTNEEALALLEEAERLLPPAGRGLPSRENCQRLAVIASELLCETPSSLVGLTDPGPEEIWAVLWRRREGGISVRQC